MFVVAAVIVHRTRWCSMFFASCSIDSILVFACDLKLVHASEYWFMWFVWSKACSPQILKYRNEAHIQSSLYKSSPTERYFRASMRMMFRRYVSLCFQPSCLRVPNRNVGCGASRVKDARESSCTQLAQHERSCHRSRQ